MNRHQLNSPWYKRRWIYYVYLILLSLPLSELAARLVGYEPYTVKEYSVCSSPSNCLAPDSLLGLRLAPGNFKVTINDGLTYQASHSLFGTRVHQSSDTVRQDSIILLGCSFTYGMGVNDNETFASILQKSQLQNEIVNYGVPGYGTVQSLIQLEHTFKKGSSPVMVVLFFSKLHFERNTLSPSYRKALKHGYERTSLSNKSLIEKSRVPYYDLEVQQIRFVKWKNLYSNWVGRKNFAIVNYLNSNLDKANREKLKPIETTKAILGKMITLCKQNNSDFKVCFLDESEDVHIIKEYCQKNSIDYVSIGLTHEDADLTNLPFDSHPNIKGHQKVAEKIIPWLVSR